jgi:hypothetical protein
LLLPGGRGAHAEFGAALALKKRLVLLDIRSNINAPNPLLSHGHETTAFYHHPHVEWAQAVDVPTAAEELLRPIC